MRVNWSGLLLTATTGVVNMVEGNEYGPDFEPMYPPHSPLQRFTIMRHLCSRRLMSISRLKFKENENARKFSLTINEFLDNIEQYYSRKRGDHGACEYFARGELAQIGHEKVNIRESVEKRNKEYQFMNQQILADIPVKVYELAKRAEQMEKQLEQLEEAYFDSYTDASVEDAEHRHELRIIIDDTKTLLTEQLDWFDIYEFLHQAGASGELLSTLSQDDLTAVSQCEIGLYRLIIRFTANCTFTEQLVLSTLQWFEYFKQYYKCIIKHESPPSTTKLELKPPGQTARSTFLLQSLSHHQCLTHSGLDL